MKHERLVLAGLLLVLAWAVARTQTGAAVAQNVADTATSAGNSLLGFMGMRGIRNNNPGNIRRGGTPWQGMSAAQTDPSFVQFDTPEYGIRALSKLLDTYSTRYGLNTVRGIVERFAPPSENDSAAYVMAVAQALNVPPDEAINVQASKAALVQAIIRHENGIQPYALATIEAGVTMA